MTVPLLGLMTNFDQDLTANGEGKRKKIQPSHEAAGRIILLAPTFAVSFSLLRSFASSALFRG